MNQFSFFPFFRLHVLLSSVHIGSAHSVLLLSRWAGDNQSLCVFLSIVVLVSFRDLKWRIKTECVTCSIFQT